MGGMINQDIINAQQAEIDRLRDELAEAKADADSLRAELAEIGGDQRLSAEAKDLKLRIDALESAQIDYEAQCAAKDGIIADAQQDCADARSSLRETEEELAATALDLTAANARIAESDKMVAELETECIEKDRLTADMLESRNKRIAKLEEAHKDALANVVVAHVERLAAAARAERAEARIVELEESQPTFDECMAYVARSERAEAELKAAREALQQLVTDYEDVPGPYDAEGQAVFAKARAVLAPSPAGREG